jgi:hypothetical protein
VAKNSRYFRSGYDTNGNSLDITPITIEHERCDSGNGLCSNEHVGVNVSKEYLEQHAKEGLRFKLIGQNGEQIINISGPSIEGFLMALPQKP